MASLFYDVRAAARSLRAARGFVALTVSTIALAVGLTTGVFSVVHAVLLRPLPYSDPDRLVAVGKTWPGITEPAGVSQPELLDWRDRARSFDRIEFYARMDFTLIGSSSSDWLVGARVSPALFDLMGVRPLLGRSFHPSEDTAGHHLVAMMSERLWRTRFGADPGVIGTRVRLDPFARGEPDSYEIVGVLPSRVEVSYRYQMDLFVPFVGLEVPRATGQRRTADLFAIARLKTGVSPEQAAAEMRDLMATLNREYPMGNPDTSATVRPLHEHLFGSTRRTSATLMGAVAVVLLIATVNIASLLLARSRRRRHELAVRLAIGCSRGRLLQQIAAEYTLLALAGGCVGVLLSIWVTRLFVSYAPAALPRAGEATLDLRLLLFSAGLTTACALCSAIVPALRAAQTPARASLTSPTAAGSVGAHRFRTVLIVAQCALVMVLLAGAGLLANSAWKLGGVRLGFDPRHVLSAQILLPPRWSWELGNRPDFDRRVLARVRALPGVVQAAVSSDVPMSTGSLVGVELEGHSRHYMTYVTAIDGEYLSLLRIPLVLGRPLTDRDTGTAPRVALVSRSFANRFWPDSSALGRRLTLRDTYEVVGVVEDVTELTDGISRMRRGLVEMTSPAVYVPIHQAPWTRQVNVLVRTAGPPQQLAGPLVAAIHAVDPGVAPRT